MYTFYTFGQFKHMFCTVCFRKNHDALYLFAWRDSFRLFCTIFPFLQFIFPVTDFMNLILSGQS